MGSPERRLVGSNLGNTIRTTLGDTGRRYTDGVFNTSLTQFLSLWLVLIFAIRLALAITHDTFLGIDGGAYLLGMYQFWGDGPSQTGIPRPPLAPGFLLVPFVALWGVTPLAFNLYAAIGSMIVFPFYWLLAREILGPKWAALAVVALSLDWHQWTLFVTGVVPVFGFGMLCLALWAMLRVQRTDMPPANIHAVVLVISIPLIALSNQTSFGIAVIALGVGWLVLPGRKYELLALLMIGGLLAFAIAHPWYLPVLPGQDRVAAPGPLFYLAPIYQFQWWQVFMFAPMLGAALFLHLRHRHANLGIKVILAVASTHLLASFIFSNDEAIMNILFRGAIWVTLPMWIVIVWLVSQWRSAYRPLMIAAMIPLAAMGAGWVYTNQFQYSEHMSRDVLDAVHQLDLDEVTLIGSNGESRANWISAVSGKPVVWLQPAHPAPAYVEQEHQARCELGWLEGCATGVVSHWIIDKTVRQNPPSSMDTAPNPLDPWGDLGAHADWLTMVWSHGNVEVWEHH